MSKPKQEDVLYSFLRSKVGNALDLEYAIRAAETQSQSEMEALRLLDRTIREFWVSRGASKEEIDAESLMDFAWDTLQVGFPLTRRHGRIFHPGLLHVINEALSTIRQKFSSQIHLIAAVPATGFFRVCDLLARNDITHILEDVNVGLRAAKMYKRKDSVPLGKFRLRVREPIHLHPAFFFGTRESEGKLVFGFEVDLAGDLDLLAWRRQINEFQYQYALYRGSTVTTDRISGKLIHDFLSREHHGAQAEHDVPGIDSFLPMLTGLYCWDLHKRDGLTLNTAIARSLTFYHSANSGDENMRKNYKNTAARIKKMAARFNAARVRARSLE